MTDQTTTAGPPVRAGLAHADVMASALGLLRRAWVMRTLSILFVLGLWEWAGRIPVSPTFPTFTQTMVALFGTFSEQEIAGLADYLASLTVYQSSQGAEIQQATGH